MISEPPTCYKINKSKVDAYTRNENNSVSPIFKTGGKLCAGNYRPISFISVVYYVLEDITWNE